ncbi:BlaI/MecI/CopY family transcriptional regulator [Clostridium sp. JNZ J1-5]
MSKIHKISNAEWEVMKIIWAHSEITSTNIIQELKDKTQWKSSAIKSLINRMQKKYLIWI